MDKIIKNTETLKDLFKCNPLVSNRFVIKLPKSLGINEWQVQGFDIKNKNISFSVIELKDKNIRDNFEDIDRINSLIKENNNAIIEYLDPYGVVIRREIYSDIKYIGESYCGYNYKDEATVITTSLDFTFKNRKNATAS